MFFLESHIKWMFTWVPHQMKVFPIQYQCHTIWRKSWAHPPRSAYPAPALSGKLIIWIDNFQIKPFDLILLAGNCFINVQCFRLWLANLSPFRLIWIFNKILVLYVYNLIRQVGSPVSPVGLPSCCTIRKYTVSARVEHLLPCAQLTRDPPHGPQPFPAPMPPLYCAAVLCTAVVPLPVNTFCLVLQWQHGVRCVCLCWACASPIYLRFFSLRSS
jgi:hypothetical protein